VRVFRQKFSLEDAIEFHTFAPLEASMRLTNDIPLGFPRPLTVSTVHSIQILKAKHKKQIVDAFLKSEGGMEHTSFAGFYQLFVGQLLQDVADAMEDDDDDDEEGDGSITPAELLHFIEEFQKVGGLPDADAVTAGWFSNYAKTPAEISQIWMERFEVVANEEGETVVSKAQFQAMVEQIDLGKANPAVLDSEVATKIADAIDDETGAVDSNAAMPAYMAVAKGGNPPEEKEGDVNNDADGAAA
jgi:hypothetical protein